MAAKTTVCNHEVMALCFTELSIIVANLHSAYEKAEQLISEFDEAYEGDAKSEVNMFLTSLPRHIYRLELFYSKMMNFIMMTSLSFMENDTQMADKMER